MQLVSACKMSVNYFHIRTMIDRDKAVAKKSFCIGSSLFDKNRVQHRRMIFSGDFVGNRE